MSSASTTSPTRQFGERVRKRQAAMPDLPDVLVLRAEQLVETRRNTNLRDALSYYHNAHLGLYDREILDFVGRISPVLNDEGLTDVVASLRVTGMDFPLRRLDAHFDQRLKELLSDVPEQSRSRMLRTLIDDNSERLCQLTPQDARLAPARSIVSLRLLRVIRRSSPDEILDELEYAPPTLEFYRLARSRFPRHDPYHAELDVYFAGHCTNLDDESSEALARNPSKDAREALAANPWLTNVRAQEILAVDPIRRIPYALAENPSLTSSELQRTFAFSDFKDFHVALARNPALTDLSLHTSFAKDSSSEIRQAIADNVSLRNVGLQRSLTQDPDHNVRIHIARNTSLTDIAVQAELAQRLQIDLVREAIAGNSSLRHVPIQSELVVDPQWQVRSAMARNPSLTDTSLHEALEGDRDDRVRASLLTNPSISDERFLRLLRSTPPIDVRKLPQHTRVRLLDASIQSEFPDQFMEVVQSTWNSLDNREQFSYSLQHPTQPRFSYRPPIFDAVYETLDTMMRHRIPLPTDWDKVRTWNDLPNRDDLSFPTTWFENALGHQTLAGFTPRSLRTGREVRTLRKRMGNCVSQYIPELQSRKMAMAVFEDPDRNNVYVAGWRLPGRTAHLVEINAIYDRSTDVPPDLAEAVQHLDLHQV